jgi:hypothetical protein
MPVGDSITKGVTGSDDNWGYRQPLYQKLLQAGYEVDFVGSQADGDFADPNHEGHGSWSDADIAWGQVGYPTDGIYAWLEQNPADIILLHIGTNYIDTSPDDVEDILDEIDRYESNYNTEVIVLVARIIKLHGSEAIVTAFNNNVQAMVMDRISNPSNPAYPDKIIPPNSVDMENALDYPEDFYNAAHPNDDGYAKMADVWFAALEDVLTSSYPISHWKFDEGSGTTAYDSAGDNEGTVYGATWTTGKISGALEFDGQNDYVDTPINLDLSKAWTVSIWIKSNKMTPGGIYNLGGSYYNGKIGIESRNDYTYGGFRFRYAANPPNSVINTPVVNEGGWHHIVWQQDGGSAGSTYAVYVDGEIVAAKTVPIDKYATIPFRIGWEGTFGYYNGTLDDVRIYDKALSAEDIKKLYGKSFAPNPADGATGVDPDVVLSWSAGGYAVPHDVYLGTDYDDVKNADTSSPLYKGSYYVHSFDPSGLALMTTYYWRIDEDRPSGIIKGDVWSFTTELDPDIVGWWKLDEGSGTTASDSAGDYDGTLEDDPGPQWVPGKVGLWALDFDGDDYVEIEDDDDLDIPGALTLAFWTKYTSEHYGHIISKGKTGTAYGYWVGIEPEQGRIRFGDDDGFKKTTKDFNDGNWHYVVCVYDGGSTFDALKIYVDNVEQATTNQGEFHDNHAGFDATNEPLMIGAHSADGSTMKFFRGTIDDARIYKRALSEEEIWQLLSSYIPGSLTKPAGN